MSEEAKPKGDRAAPKRPEVRFYVSERVWKYLEWIGRHSILGEDPNDIAERVLIQRLSNAAHPHP